MLEILRVIIWKILQQIFYTHALFNELKIRITALLCWSYDLCSNSTSREQLLLEQCKQQLSKCPRHLCVILSPESKQINGKVLRRLFSYALIVGIECVSVYDRRKLGNGYVDLANLEPPKNMQCIVQQERGFVWVAKDLKSTENNVKRNGLQSNGYTSNGHKAKKLLIQPINVTDGHALIAQVCRELHEMRTTPKVQKLLEQRSLLTEYISDTLEQRLGLPGIAEPELGIIFAKDICTYGFLPWHIRFTEFYRLPSACYFNAQTFANVLFKYSRCEQRWGK